MSQSKVYTLLLLGDVMIGRLIDALLPSSIARQAPKSDPEAAARTVEAIVRRSPDLKSYNYLSPMGNSVDLVRKADLVLANLETALTISEKPWPRKVFNYRSHPENVGCLTQVGFADRGYVSLANNHTLDWCLEGLHETVATLHNAGIRYAGAGRSPQEATQPAVLEVGSEEDRWDARCWSFADHPSDWKGIEAFNLVDYTDAGREKIRQQLMADQHNQHGKLGLKIVSMHWGPNYRWHPDKDIFELAHWMVDECGVDLIHGHSSHHVQGVEIFKHKLIVYGCGDFVDDYAVDPQWRNDLSAAWRVTVGSRASASESESGLEIKQLEVFPNRIQRFQAHLLDKTDSDHAWVTKKFRQLCDELGTKVESEPGSDGQVIVHVNDRS
jgi:poly-gamma-glutamate capsule biosynthesis protein CapA/YwtB (metallophosphatase superfamily)